MYGIMLYYTIQFSTIQYDTVLRIISNFPRISFFLLAPHRRKSHISRENLMSYQFRTPLTRKSPVSYLMRKSHVSRENLISFQFWAPPNEKISCLLSHEKISCSKRKSHVLSVLGPPL